MAVRKKSGGSGSDGSKKAAAPRKRVTTGKTVRAPQKRTPEAAAEELVHVGGDVVPTVPVEAEALVSQPDEVLSEAGPILPDAGGAAGHAAH